MINFEDIDYKRLDEETEDDYTLRICALKEIKHLYWDEIAQIINRTLDQNYTESRYRKMYSAYTKGKADAVKEEEIPEISEYMQQKIELQKERIKISDERVQTNAYIRQLAREETIKEIASKCAQEMNSKKLLEAPKELYISGKNAAILQLSDIHYGLVVDNYWNKYNPDIAKNKISQLRDKVIQYCKFNDVSDLYITELGDAIAGRIHETIKYQSRFDVITQIMQISEIIAEMITDLSKHFKIHYYCFQARQYKCCS